MSPASRRWTLRVRRPWFPLTLGLGLVLCVAAEEPQPGAERLQSSPVLRSLRPNPVARTPVSAAEETVARMHVPEGFRVDLVAAEPEVHQPIALAWDARGRLWVAEAHSYPTRRPPGEGEDRLVILADRDGDGRFETRRVFAEGLNLVSGFAVGHGGVWVGAAPELLFLPDADQDDVPDSAPRVLLDGFGFQDTHECLNSFLWGPDGWLYGIQGVFNYGRIGRPGSPDAGRQELRAGVWRYHPVRHEFEVFAHGGSNPWGLDHDAHGQLFMTHCRSYWGGGGTTHVIQGGQFWNQANANYAPWIIANPPREFPEFRNFLLASARYDHGAGGAGAPGSDAIYGGHSHVGTLIYQGDNWPDRYRGHLFTHNLHGHQINHQVNHREGSGFHTVHGGDDVLFCTDPQYVAVALVSGPDGAVYFSDWCDLQHCHNPHTERWDRSNGRIYRMVHLAGWTPRNPDLTQRSDADLVRLLTHRNAWHARTARRLLAERAAAGRPLDPAAAEAIRELATAGATAADRLQGLWTAHAALPGADALRTAALSDPDEFVRAWGVQLSAEAGAPLPESVRSTVLRMASDDPSALVRLHLAAASQRLPAELGWLLVEALARHTEDREDRNLPPLLWTALAPRLVEDPGRALALARTTAIPRLADWIHWYAATLGGDPLERSVAAWSETPDQWPRRLAGLWLALEPRGPLPMPTAWTTLGPRLAAHPDPRLARLSQRVAAAFGDTTAFPELRAVLADPGRPADQRRHAFAVLGRAADPAAFTVFVALLDEPDYRTDALRLLARFDTLDVPAALLKRQADWDDATRNAAFEVLTRRPAHALALLQAVADGRVPRNQLTALHMRQLGELRDARVDAQIARSWGRIQSSPEDLLARMAGLQHTFEEAPLWAYDGRAGRRHFQQLCAPCHVLGPDGSRLGPELTGAGRNGIRYYLENILDPDAVVGTDYQMTSVETRAGDVVSGLVLQETDTAITLRTPAEERVIAKADVVRRERSERSLMPGGLLESLNAREQLELLKYLTEN
ncbi:MAG: hypothetical protein KF791_10915 [Verrucomicrobiae bacterium]|nr:hypothetical protein [Verrucomicrobiae bacterium]